MSEPDERPPQAPDIERRFQLRRYQWIGMPLLMLIPLLALVGLFDERRATAVGSSALLELRVDYPSRLRHPHICLLEVQVRNLSTEPLETVTVSFAPSYLAAFSRVHLVPAPDEPHTVELRELWPGEVRRIRLEGEGERYGRYAGVVAASSAGAQVRVPVSTFLIP